MSAQSLVTARDQRALAFLFAEWDALPARERVRRTAKLAKRLRTALDEERSLFTDDTAFLVAVGAAIGAPAPLVQTPLGISEPQPLDAPVPRPPSGVATRRPHQSALRTPYWATAAVASLVLVVLVALTPLLPLGRLLPGTAGEPVTLAAFGPVEQPPSPDVSIHRVAVSLAVTSHSNALVFVSPLQFRARDSENGYHRANVEATLEVDTYRLVASGPGTGGAMGAATLRSGETLAGYVVFDVPVGTRLTQIVLTAGRRELTVEVPADRFSVSAPWTGGSAASSSRAAPIGRATR